MPNHHCGPGSRSCARLSGKPSPACGSRHPHADHVGRFTVFNVGGNKYHLIGAIHYNRGKVYVRHVLTHKEYDRGHGKDD
jgi:hypothetical protein